MVSSIHHCSTLFSVWQGDLGTELSQVGETHDVMELFSFRIRRNFDRFAETHPLYDEQGYSFKLGITLNAHCAKSLNRNFTQREWQPLHWFRKQISKITISTEEVTNTCILGVCHAYSAEEILGFAESALFAMSQSQTISNVCSSSNLLISGQFLNCFWEEYRSLT